MEQATLTRITRRAIERRLEDLWRELEIDPKTVIVDWRRQKGAPTLVFKAMLDRRQDAGVRAFIQNLYGLMNRPLEECPTRRRSHR